MCNKRLKPIVTKDAFISTYILKKFGEKAYKKYEIWFPVYPDALLTEIAADLMTDGHLQFNSYDGKYTRGQFYFSSKNLKDMVRFSDTVNDRFGLRGTLHELKRGSVRYRYHICNLPLTRILLLSGVPNGNKTLKDFDIPSWVWLRRSFQKIFIQRCFDAEGSIFKDNYGWHIRFGINKDVNVLVNGCKFIDSLRRMLANFNIKTSNTWITSPVIRKDGSISKQIVFSIRSKENIIRFRNKIDFNNIERKNKLAEAVRELNAE